MSPTTWTHATETYTYSTRDDLADIATMLADPEVGRHLWFTPLEPEMVAGYFGPLLDGQWEVLQRGEVPGTAVFVVRDEAGGFLGQGAVVAVEGSPGGFEIGFQLRRESWGRGVGSRLSRFLCAYAVVLLDAHRIEGGCLAGNAASCRLMEKVGLRVEGERPGYRLKEGVRHAELLYGALVADLDAEAIAAVASEVGLQPGP